jgi:hypothetical protein
MIMYKYPILVFLLFWIHYALLYVVSKNIENIEYIYIYIYLFMCVVCVLRGD